MKGKLIDWDKLPEWVNWVAKDRCGSWYGYECEPTKEDGMWLREFSFQKTAQVRESIVLHIEPTEWGKSLVCKADDIRNAIPSPLEEVLDVTERQLWCGVYLETHKANMMNAVMSGTNTDCNEMVKHADKAVAEYRKRYGCER